LKANLIKAPKHETAILAGGCFWAWKKSSGRFRVSSKRPWDTAGARPRTRLTRTLHGTTGHAEAIEVAFDPARLSYEGLLGYFLPHARPTTLNRQHNDVGTQYRSAIFYTSDEQKQTAERVKAKLEEGKSSIVPITTEITPASKFYSAEEYHQKYLGEKSGRLHLPRFAGLKKHRSPQRSEVCLWAQLRAPA